MTVNQWHISRIIQQLLKYFNGTAFVAPFNVLLSSLSLFDVFPVTLLLYLNDAEFVMGSALLPARGLLPALFGSSL